MQNRSNQRAQSNNAVPGGMVNVRIISRVKASPQSIGVIVVQSPEKQEEATEIFNLFHAPRKPIQFLGRMLHEGNLLSIELDIFTSAAFSIFIDPQTITQNLPHSLQSIILETTIPHRSFLVLIPITQFRDNYPKLLTSTIRFDAAALCKGLTLFVPANQI